MYYPHESPVGKQLYEGGCTSCPPTTVIGVVGDVQYRGLAGEADAVYAPLARSEEHTSELQSQSNLVCRLLLEKKKTIPIHHSRTCTDTQTSFVESLQSSPLDRPSFVTSRPSASTSTPATPDVRA